MSLQQFLLAKGITVEKTVEIEYIKAVAPRKEEEPLLHDDWVSAVDGSSPGLILTGCYDGFGWVWKGPGLCTHVFEGHGGAVSSVCIINTTDPLHVLQHQPPGLQHQIQEQRHQPTSCQTDQE